MEKKVSKLINDQINKEMYSAYLYLEFANHFTEKGLVLKLSSPLWVPPMTVVTYKIVELHYIFKEHAQTYK